MQLKGANRWTWLLMAALPITLATVCYATYPFSDVIAKKTLSTTGLTPAQKSNIQLAAHALDGIVLRSGEKLSFNKVVGPRTSGRGYRQAPAYLGSDNATTNGGGVCLVSSALYQLALETGCQIEERVAHLRTVRTVPAGLDATVWYGQADLCFKNELSCPVQINSSWDNNSVSLSMKGKMPVAYTPAKLSLSVVRKTPQEMVVELFRRQGSNDTLVSRDHYMLTSR